MASYVADTHALLWYLSGSQRLGADARITLDEAVTGVNEILIPAIVIAEFIRITKKYGQAVDVARILTSLQEKPGFHLTALTPDIVLGIRPLTMLPDLHDRLIVAEAIANGAKLITCDKAITASGATAVVW
jgi:PIN domain nuclease of toxin-antitoxin system